MKIRIKVSPNSKIEGISQKDDSLIVKVKEPPKEGRANQAVIELLAEYFSMPQSHIRILSGIKSKNKVVEITD